VNPDEFNQMMAYLYSRHYQTVTTSDALAGNIPQKSIILSFDDGYDDFYTLAYPALKKYHYTAVLAMITGKIDKPGFLSSKQLREISDYGIEIFSHTVSHPDLSKTAGQRAEIFDSKKVLENLTGKAVTGFVYPSGKFNAETLKLLDEAGYKIAFTEKPDVADFSSKTLLLHRIRIRGRFSLLMFELLLH
jgi:peptidoglycan/xylan/chitin deacetylase (PgdA/CDA1 family)